MPRILLISLTLGCLLPLGLVGCGETPKNPEIESVPEPKGQPKAGPPKKREGPKFE